MDDVAAALRPGEPFSDADQILLLFAFVLVLGNTQVLWNEGWADRVEALLALGDFLHDLPHNVGDLALEVSHACFTGILSNHALDCRIGKLDVLVADPMLLKLSGNQEFSADPELFFLRIPRDFDDLHPIAKRGENGILEVGRRDEHDVRKIEWYAQIVIAERAIWFGVKHFEKRSRGSPAQIHPDLVHLVHHEYRIVGAGLLDPLNDPPRQRADIGSPMTADLGLITNAAQRDPHELPA